MKIYFAASITGGRGDQQIYFDIIKMLGKHGTVLTEHIGDKKLTSGGEQHSAEYVFNRDHDWVCEADVIIAETTTPSLGVGYELGLAESLKKPVICFYRITEGKHLSKMISGNSNFLINNYSTLEDISKILDSYFTKNFPKSLQNDRPAMKQA